MGSQSTPKKGAMLNECINVQLNLRYRIGIITRTRLLVSVLKHASVVPTPNGRVSGECVKGGFVSKIPSIGAVLGTKV